MKQDYGDETEKGAGILFVGQQLAFDVVGHSWYEVKGTNSDFICERQTACKFANVGEVIL